MNIGISELFARPIPGGGAESMLQNVIDGLLAAKLPTDQLTLYSNIDRSASALPIRCVRLPGGKTMNRFLQESLVLPWFGRELDTILFGNYFTAPVMPSVRSTTIIHDLQQVHFPENFSQKKRLWLRLTQEFTMRKADTVVTLSEFCKEDILNSYGKKFEAKVHVIPNPISWMRYEKAHESSIERQQSDFPYFLSVAAQYPHKNLETLIRAFSVLHSRFPEFKLVLVGQLARNLVGTSRKSRLEELIASLDLEKEVLITGFVSDEELGTWYTHATLFVFPSLFEGFGMPPVEALGLRIPVLTTRCGSLFEVTLGRAEYLDDPLDHAEMAERMKEMIENENRYQVSDETVGDIRSTYDSRRIGKMYYKALGG